MNKKNTKLLIISDLHVGPTARAKDFRTDDGDNSSAITENYINDFKEFIDKEQIKADYLIIAGDLSNNARSEEFILAGDRIQNIMDILNISNGNTFFVPGNHDNNWALEKKSIESGDCSELARTKKYDVINNIKFFDDLLSNAYYSAYYKDPYASIWIDDTVIIVGINSSAYDKYDKNKKFGEVNLNCLSTIMEQIDKIKENKQWDDKFKILLTHHHPISYTDKTFTDPDLSQMVNAEDFLNFSHKYEFDFIVHGHKHIPRFKSSLSSNTGSPENILSAGSFSADLTKWHNGVPNHFHLIELHGCCPQHGYPRGKVLSWSYFLKHKWLRSNIERDDINHEEYFGYLTSRKEMKKLLTAVITKEFSLKDHVEWESFLDEYPDLQYSDRSLVHTAIKELSTELQFTFMISKADQFILWKKTNEKV